jgi:hypothetical protein
MKVLGFDNWAQGAHSWERFVPAFRKRGLELTLTHLGSWGNDVGRPPRETHGELSIRDIRSYSPSRLPEILDAEKPDAVLFMSIDTFAHRAFNRYCRQRNIPTVHLFHAIIGVQAAPGSQPYKIRLRAHLAFVASKVLKALKHVWPAYARALWTSGAGLRDWLRFASDIANGVLGRLIHSKTSARDAKTDMCCVYVPGDFDHAIGRYVSARDDVVAVGNPDLFRFRLSQASFGIHLDAPSERYRDVMYVDGAFFLVGQILDSPADYVEHLIATRDSLARQGKRLVIKPHPGLYQHAKGGSAESILASIGAEVCPNEEFVARLQQCCACIVEPSTAAMVPALMGLPLFLANYGKFTGCGYGKILHSYPRVRSLKEISQFAELLLEARNDDVARTREWIGRNSGPMPAEQMPERVADVMAELIQRRQAASQRSDLRQPNPSGARNVS